MWYFRLQPPSLGWPRSPNKTALPSDYALSHSSTFVVVIFVVCCCFVSSYAICRHRLQKWQAINSTFLSTPFHCESLFRIIIMHRMAPTAATTNFVKLRRRPSGVDKSSSLRAMSTTAAAKSYHSKWKLRSEEDWVQIDIHFQSCCFVYLAKCLQIQLEMVYLWWSHSTTPFPFRLFYVFCFWMRRSENKDIRVLPLKCTSGTTNFQGSGGG